VPESFKVENAKQGRVEAVEERLAIERNLSEREADLAASQDSLRESAKREQLETI